MSNPMGDRNLLAGILAHQKKFISREVLLAAMNAWTQAKEKGLAQILREQKALTENQHALLEEAVHDHLLKHGNDAKKSLAALSSADALKQELAKIADADLQASVAHVATAKPKVKPAAAASIVVEELVEVEDTPKKKPGKAAPKKSPPRTAPAQKPAGMPMWALLVGGGIVAGFIGLIAILAIALAVVLLRDEKPIAQVKPDAPAQDSKPVEKPADQPPPPKKAPIIPKDPPIEPELPIEPDPVEIPVKLPPPVVADGFVPLFNGKDLTNWKQAASKPRNWQVSNGILTADGGGFNMLYTPRDDYGDFHLRAEIRMNEDSWSSLAFRYPYGPAELEKSKLAGYVLHLAGKPVGSNRTGNLMIWEKLGARNLPAPANAIQAGEWFTLDIIAKGENVVTKLNGVESINHTYPKAHLLGGRIVLATGAAVRNPRIEYRKIEIKEFKAVLAPPTPLPEQPLGEFVKLFNGSDLADWRIGGNAVWKVTDGEIVGQGPGALVSKRGDFRNCIVRVEVLPSPDIEAFFSFREHPDPEGRMPMKGLSSRLTGDGKVIRAGHTGIDGSKGETGAVPNDFKANEWMTIEFHVRPESISTKTNGKSSGGLGFHPERFPAGAVGLHVIKGSVRIRRFEISSESAPGGDFVSLFNGRDLTGWKKHPRQGGNWSVENGILAGWGEGKGNLAGLLFTDRVQPKNFHLRVETRVGDKGHGGVTVRCPEDSMFGYDALVDSVRGAINVGDLHYQTPGDRGILPGRPVRVMPPDQWITLEIIANEGRLIVKVNGAVTTDVEDAKTLNAGHIRLSHSSAAVKIEFRKIEIKDLNPGAPPGPVVVAPAPKDAPPFPVAKEFVPLFNGKDLIGWKLPPGFGDNWRVEKGVLIGAAPPQRLIRLHTQAKFKDFHLRAEARSGDKNVGILGFRSSDGVIRGYNTGMVSMGPGGLRTGVLNCNTPEKNFGVTRLGIDEKIPPGQWFNLEVIAQGNRFTVIVNGKKITDAVDDTVADAGFIYLGLSGKEPLEFRKLEIKELNAVAVAPPPVIKDAPAAGVVSLFNGKDLAGWQPHAKRPGNWRVENGILIGSAPIGGALYSTRGDYQDFHLRAELRINDKGFGRILGRTTYEPTKVPFKVHGYEVLINQRPLGDKTGTLLARSPLANISTQAKEAPAPAGEWITLEVIAKGDLVTVKVNGNAVAECRDDQRQFARSGHIALHQDANATIEFRKVEIEDLAAKAVAPPAPEVQQPAVPPLDLPKGGKFVSLLDNKELAGWKTFGDEKGAWQIKDGILIGTGPAASRIHTPRGDYKNYHLRVEARISDQGAAGVVVRAPLGSFKGYEAKINSTHPSPNKTGSLEAWVPGKAVNVASVRESPVPFGEWFTMEIIALDNRLIVIVNGKTTADTIDVDGDYISGHIALRYVANAQIEFRTIEIKEFPAQ
jgi:hypothetical protein